MACYKEPFHRDEKRLVNYFGPDPSRYDKPDAPEQAPHAPPEMVNYWVKNAEPIPRPAPNGNLANLPWLDPVMAKADAERREIARLSANPKGTQALLNHMGIDANIAVAVIKPVAKKTVTKPAPTPQQAAVQPTPSVQPATSVPSVQPAPLAQPNPPVIEVDVN